MANVGLRCDKDNWSARRAADGRFFASQVHRANPDSVSYAPGAGLLAGRSSGAAAGSAAVESALRFGLPAEQGDRVPVAHLFAPALPEAAVAAPVAAPRADWDRRWR